MSAVYRSLISAAFVFATSVVCTVADAHSFGAGEADLTPPMMQRAEDLEALKNDFGGAAAPLRGVFEQMQLWNAGSTLKACFYDGDPRLKALFVQTARQWLEGISLRVDFGSGPEFNSCNDTAPQDIRITFVKQGNWSFVGTDSIRPEIIKQGPSLNVGIGGLPFERINKDWFTETTLHEFGHALGLLHEHQSPVAKCGDEFDWPKVIAYAKNNWGWDEYKVRFNFEPYFSEPRLQTTPYDRKSIMHYALAEWMFKKGRQSRCFISQPKTISSLDRVAIAQAYPPTVSLQDRELQRRAATTGKVMAQLKLNAAQLGIAGAKLAASMKQFDRKVFLQFALVDNGTILRAGPDTLNPCEGDKLSLAKIPKVSCGVAPDGSGFVIEINPDFQKP